MCVGTPSHVASVQHEVFTACEKSFWKKNEKKNTTFKRGGYNAWNINEPSAGLHLLRSSDDLPAESRSPDVNKSIWSRNRFVKFKHVSLRRHLAYSRALSWARAGARGPSRRHTHRENEHGLRIPVLDEYCLLLCFFYPANAVPSSRPPLWRMLN